MDFDASAFDSTPGPQKILGARFKPIQHAAAVMVVQVFAQNLYVGGAQLFARVGKQPVQFLLPTLGGRGFSGTLRQMPHEGDRLYVRYSGRIEHPTSIVYHSPGNKNVA